MRSIISQAIPLVIAVILTTVHAERLVAQPADPVVLTSKVETRSIRPSFTHPARIEAIQTGFVRPELRARITAMHITAGAAVNKGDLLVELDPTDFQIALAEAEANLKEAKANAVKAELDLNRAELLVGRGTVSESEAEFATAQAEVARAQVVIAEAKVNRAKKDLDATKVFAPFSGRISAPVYSVGDLYAPGDPTRPAAVAEIVSLDPIYATGLVDQSNYFEYLARRLRIEAAGRSIPPLELEVLLPGGFVYPVKGTFENWDNTATGSTGTIAARVLFDNPDATLLPGQTVTLQGRLIEAVDAPLVPQRAVGLDQQGHFVWVVNSDGMVERRNVEVGIRTGSDWTVVDGLTEGDEVVVEGVQKLRPGISVTPEPFQG